jgi:hypothetical protein
LWKKTSVTVPGEGRTDRLSHGSKSSWQIPGTSVYLRPEAEPPPAPCALIDLPLQEVQEQELCKENSVLGVNPQPQEKVGGPPLKGRTSEWAETKAETQGCHPRLVWQQLQRTVLQWPRLPDPSKASCLLPAQLMGLSCGDHHLCLWLMMVCCSECHFPSIQGTKDSS